MRLDFMFTDLHTIWQLVSANWGATHMISSAMGWIFLLVRVSLLVYGIWLVVQGETKPRRMGGLVVVGVAVALAWHWRGGQWVSQSVE